jgi:hypothetical protein
MTETTTYFPKQQLRTTASFKNSSGAAVNPDTITMTISKVHSGTETVISTLAKADLTTDITGTYYYDFTPGTNGPGNYFFNWVSTNPNTEQETCAVVVDSHRV